MSASCRGTPAKGLSVKKARVLAFSAARLRPESLTFTGRGGPFVLAHVHTAAPELHAFGLQAEALLQAGFPRQPYMTSCSHHAVPGQTTGRGGMQCPDHLAGCTRMSRHSRHPTIGAHPPARDLADSRQQSLEHVHQRLITRPSPAIQRAMPSAARAPRCSRKKINPIATRSRAVATLAVSEATLIRQPAR